MVISRIKHFWNYLKANRFALLLISLMLLIVMPAFVANPAWRSLLSYVLVNLTLIVSIVIFYRTNRPKLALGIVAFVLVIIFVNWLDYFSESDTSLGISRTVLIMLMFLFMFGNIFREYKRRGEVTIDFIYGAISGFLLLGLIAALLFNIVEYYYPNSFSFAGNATEFRDYLYFSFVTITTLGYGDLLPTSNQGEVVTAMMAVTGQLYLTIIIALIIGRYLANNNR